MILKIGAKLYVTALENEDYKIMHTDNTVICQIKRARAAMAIAVDEDDDELEEGADNAPEAEGEE